MRRGLEPRFFQNGFGSPSLFDYAVMVFMIGLPAIYHNSLLYNKMAASLWLVFGAITLWAMSLSMRQLRLCRMPSLSVLTLWVGTCVFLYSWRKDPGTAEWYISWCMLNEGFICVLAAALLITTIVRYAKEWGWYYIFIIAILIGWFQKFVLPTNSNSPILALMICVPIIMWKKGEKWLSAMFSLLALGIIYFRWDWIMFKWAARPRIWADQLSNITLTGTGFPHTMTSTHGFIQGPNGYGLCYMQNDYLEFAISHGVIGIALVGWFLISIFKGARVSLAYYLGMSAAILCAFQRTIYFPIQAGIIVVIIALVCLENGRLKTTASPRSK